MGTRCPPSSSRCYKSISEGSAVQEISALSRAGSVALREVACMKWHFQGCPQGNQAGAACERRDAQHIMHPDVSLRRLQLEGRLERVWLPAQDLGPYSLPTLCFTHQSPLINLASSHKKTVCTVILHRVFKCLCQLFSTQDCRMRRQWRRAYQFSPWISLPLCPLVEFALWAFIILWGIILVLSFSL